MTTICNLTELADHLGVEAGTDDTATLANLKRATYKYTDCGASLFVTRWEDGDVGALKVTSIVEGSDAEVESDPLVFPFTDEDYDAAVQYVEDEADALWHEANDEDDEDEDDDDGE